MANYKIKIMQISQDDMKAIVAHIRIDDPDAAIRMYENIKASIGKLADFPLMGPVPLDRKIAEQGYRMVVVNPYLVFYILVMEDNTVEVHRVLHCRQFYSDVGIEKEVECYIQNNAIVIRPVRESSGEFDEQILADLISQGLSGEELLTRFKETRKKIRPAVEGLIAEAELVAKYKSKHSTYDDVFRAEDK